MDDHVFEYNGESDSLHIKMLLTNGAWITIATVDLTKAMRHPNTYLAPGFFKLSRNGHNNHLNDDPLAIGVSTPHDSEAEQV